MKLRICFGFFMMLGIFSLSSMSSVASVVELKTFEQLVKEANYIIIGVVKGNMRHIEEWDQTGEHFYAHSDIVVEKVIKAPDILPSGSNEKERQLPNLKNGSLITLRYDDPAKVDTSLRIIDKERAIWFLIPNPKKTDCFAVLGTHQGKFLIENNIVYKNVDIIPPPEKEKYKQGTLKNFLKQIKATMDALKKQDINQSSRQSN